MSEPISFGKPEFNVVASMEDTTSVTTDPGAPFRVAILGDFSGRAGRTAEVSGAALSRRPVAIDRDNFDDVMRKLNVELQLRLSGDDNNNNNSSAPPVSVRFAEFEDFHPDRLYERLAPFQMLRQTRKRLRDPATFESAAAEVRSWGGAKEPVAPREQSAPSVSTPLSSSAQPASDDSSRDLLEQMLREGSRVSSAAPDSSSGLGDLREFLRDIVRPHLVANDEAREAELVDAVDAAAGEVMRSILHHPDFQALEAAWRGLHFLVSRVETDAKLKLYILDVTRDELAADLSASEDLRESSLYKLLVEQSVGTHGGEPWALIAGNYTFGATRDDAELLASLATIAQQARAPFVAGASPQLFGCKSLAQTPDPDDWQEVGEVGDDARLWKALRHLPESVYLGLAAPRFLLRLPYGAETEPLESLSFEEMPEGTEPPHEQYLWGNATFACACLLAESFSRDGWEMRPGDLKEIEGLPLHIYESDGESQVKPCAEATLTERAAERILDRGVMPLLSFKGGDQIRLARFQSLADPPTALAGRWTAQ